MSPAGLLKSLEQPRIRRAVLAVAALGMLGVFASATRRALDGGSSEFRGYRHIVQTTLVRGQDPYKDITHVRAYPPVFALMWAPFGLLPMEEPPHADALRRSPLRGIGTGAAMLLIGSVLLYVGVLSALTVASARWTARAATLEADRGKTSLPALAAWILASGIMLNGIARCETDMLVVGLISAGMFLLFARNRPGWGGALLGTAAAFKLTPGLFGVYLLLRGRWRALGGMIAAGLVCTVLVPCLAFGPKRAVDLTRSWAEVVLVPYATGGREFIVERPYRSANQSLTAAIVRYTTPYNHNTGKKRVDLNVLSFEERTALRVATAAKATVLVLLCAAWLTAGRRPGRERELLLFALVPVGMLLLSDISHGSQLSVMLIPFGVLAGWCAGHGADHRAQTIGILTLAAFVLIHMIAFPPLKQMAVGTGAVVLVFATLLALSWRTGRPEEPAAGE